MKEQTMLTSGTLLQNRYTIVRQIGGGGMGTVYLAEDTRLPGRRCAIKEMSPVQVAPQDRNWAISAFKQEAEMLARLQHVGLTAVTDRFAEKGNWYLVMDYVDGEALDDRLQRMPGNRLPLQETLDIARQLCSVLDYLHRQNPPVVFRDLKPGNVMVTPAGEVKLIDFGIARFFKPGQTRDTVRLGTPGYAAPEQYGGQVQTDPRSDVYSMGVLLHQMVTGHDPTTTPMNLPSVRTLNATVPPYVADSILRATQPQPGLRFQSIGELLQALFQPAPPPPPPPPPPPGGHWLWMLGGVGLAMGIVLVVAITASNKPTPTPPPQTHGPAVNTATPFVIVVSATAGKPGPTSTRPASPTSASNPAPPTRTSAPQVTPTLTRSQIEAAVRDAVERFQKAKEYSQKSGDTSRLSQDLAGQALTRQVDLVNQTRAANCYWDIWLDTPMRYEFLEVLGDSYVRVKVYKTETRHRYCNGQQDKYNWVDKESYDTTYVVEQISSKWYVTQRE
jgi:serine/threonine protein kinase